MKRLSKKSTSSKRIMFFTATMLLMHTTLQTDAAVGDVLRRAGSSIVETFRAKLPSLISKTKSHIKDGVISAYNTVKGFKTEKVINMLLASITKLGIQLIEIKDCMLFGHGCSASKRTTFYASAITVLALTAVAVGFTITVASTSKEPDVEMNKAIESTSQEVKGWKPAAVFQRLHNKISTFRQNLLDMKQCLTKRRCSKRQKRALYATAATIASLVTIVIGVGVGSYLYAEHKRKKEEAGLPGEQAVVEEGFRPVFEFDEKTYPEESISPFKQLFRNTVQITQTGMQYLQNAYQQIKGQVIAGAIKTTEAAATQFFILIEKGKDFIALVQEVLSVNLHKVRDAFASAKEKLNALVENIKEAKQLTFGRKSFSAQALDLIKYIKGITDTIHIIKPLEAPADYSPLKRLARIKGQDLDYLEKMLLVRTEEWKKNKISKQQVLDVQDDIRIKQFIKLSNLNSIYPTLVEKINGLNLRQVGAAAKKVTGGLKALIDAAAWINKEAGKIGILISQSNAQESLRALGEKIKQLGENIQMTMNIDKIIATEKISTPDLAIALVDAASTKGFQFIRHNWRAAQSSIEKLIAIDQLSDEITLAIRHFSRDIRNISADTKTQFFTTIKQNPLRGIPHAAHILRLALESSVETARNSFKILLNRCITLLKTVREAAPDLYETLVSLNGYMQRVSVHNKELINNQFLQGIQQIIIDLKGTTDTAEKLSKELETIPAAAAG